MKRNASIEVYRCLLMLGICMCHSIGAGVHPCDSVRNIFMMCTVGFIFITGWFGVALSLKRLIKIVGIGVFALAVTLFEDWLLHGYISMSPLVRMRQWWFLNSYLMLTGVSPVLNCIVNCITSEDVKVRREATLSTAIIVFAIFGIAWPMSAGWIPSIRLFLTVGSRCSFGTMCAIYLVARVVNKMKLYDKINGKVCIALFACSCALATVSMSFSNYNSPSALLFAMATFYPFLRYEMKESALSRIVLSVAPSMFFVYLYHTHQDVGFVLLRSLQTEIMKTGVGVILSWIVTAFVIFVIGISIDMLRRGCVRMIVRR